MLPLSSAPVNTSQTVQWCFLSGEARSLAESAGLVQGAEVRVTASCGGSVILSVGGARLALGKELADHIQVREKKS